MLLIITILIAYAIVMPFFHELGHVIAIKIIGGEVKKFEISWSSIQGKFGYPENLTFWKYLFFTCNGVLIEIIITTAILIFIKSTTILTVISIFYLCFISLNVVPLSTTDGAFVFKSYPAPWIQYLLWIVAICIFSMSSLGLLVLWLSNDMFISKIILLFIYLLMLYRTILRFKQLFEGD